MFGWLKKKQPKKAEDSVVGLSDEQQKTLCIAAYMIKTEIYTTSDSEVFLNDKFVRGYIVGFLHASLQYKKIDVVDFDGFFKAIQAGCFYIFEENQRMSIEYASQSLSFLSDKNFESGQNLGGNDYFDFIQGFKRTPDGLARYYFDIFKPSISS